MIQESLYLNQNYMENNNTFKTLLFIVIGLAIVIGGIMLLTKHKNAGDNMVIGQAHVDEIQVMKSDAFPVEVTITAKGTLADDCTTMGDLKQNYADGKFTVVMETKKAQNAKKCSADPVPFNRDMVLAGVAGLAKGTYTIDVNGVQGAFTLGVDNFVSGVDPLK
jgi:hypothetical protein